VCFLCLKTDRWISECTLCSTSSICVPVHPEEQWKRQLGYTSLVPVPPPADNLDNNATCRVIRFSNHLRLRRIFWSTQEQNKPRESSDGLTLPMQPLSITRVVAETGDALSSRGESNVTTVLAGAKVKPTLATDGIPRPSFGTTRPKTSWLVIT
jgi:hypothetical protein